MSEKTFLLSLPEGTANKDVTFKLHSKKEAPPEKIQKFCSYSFFFNHVGTIIVFGKTIHFQELLFLLQENGLSKTVPCDVTFNPNFEYTSFNFNPIAYNGPTVWNFDWKGVSCSVVGSQLRVEIRVHDLSAGVGERVIKEIFREVAIRHPAPAVNPRTFNVFIVQQTMNGYVWGTHSSRDHRSLDTIYIDPLVKQKVLAELQDFKTSLDLYVRFGIPYKFCVLFHGPPGGGKSSFITALCSFLELNIANLTITPEMNGRDVINLVSVIPPHSVLLMEDIDSAFIGRTAVGNLSFSSLLNSMDGLSTKPGLISFFTTNHIDDLDPAMIRPGRVDLSVKFNPPDIPELRLALQSLAAQFAHEHEQYLLENPKISIAELQKHLFRCIKQKKTSILSEKNMCDS